MLQKRHSSDITECLFELSQTESIAFHISSDYYYYLPTIMHKCVSIAT